MFFVKFIKTYCGIDFEDKILSFCGPFSKEDAINQMSDKYNILNDKPLNDTLEMKAFQSNQKKLVIEPGDIVSFKLDCDDSKEFVTKNINILDPIISKNNIGLSVSKISAIRIKNTFERVNEYLKQFTNVKDREEFDRDQLHKLL